MTTRITLAGSIALAVFLALPASAQTTWSFGRINPPEAPVTKASKRFAELVTERTEGRVSAECYEGSQLGPGPAQIEAMAVGAREGYISSGSNASTLVPEFGVVDIPFVFESQQHFLNFMDGDLARGLKDELRDDFNVRILATSWFRLSRVFLTRDACVTGPEDIAGKRVRAPDLPMFIAGWEAIGTVPVTTSYGETYMGLRQGVADMTASAGEQVYSSKCYEVLPYVTDARMTYPQNSVYVAESAFQSISEEDQQIVTQAAQAAGDYFTDLVSNEQESDRSPMEKAGVTFCDMPNETRAEFSDLVAQSVDQFESEGLLPEGWWDEIQAMK